MELAELRNPQKDEPGGSSNLGVDYVIHYRVPRAERAESEAAFIQLIQALADVGFATEVRRGGDDSLLVFTKIVSDKLLTSQAYRYRVQDWLYGVRTAAPSRDLVQNFADEPVSEAERLRLAYLLITKSKNEGGAGITPKIGRWKFVDSIFPLHDRAFNKSWIKQWSSKYSLDDGDIDKIRDKFGEKVAFYFAFLQSYFTFLLFPAAFGFSAWVLLGKFSWLYALASSLWTIVFFEHWKAKELDLAVQWSVRGVSKIQHPRPEFQFDREAQDPATGEVVKVFSPLKRLSRQLLQLPFAIACIVILGGSIAGCFAIEIFIAEVYSGPFKQYLTFLPTILLSVLLPTFSTILTSIADKLTHYENYDTQDSHTAAFVQKIFVLNVITSYLPIALTAFVYLPFGKILVPYLDVFQLTAERLAAQDTPLPTKEFEINQDRLTKQVIYFTVTAQIVNLALEIIVPYAKRKVFKAVKDVQAERTSKKGAVVQHAKDAPEEAEFLARVRSEAELEEYDVTIDYREMVVQFGYLSLFSVIWPLTACSFLVNNWIEARSDAVKIAMGSKRPIPWRADSIGPWLEALGFLSWFGSITTSALLFLFKDGSGPTGSPGNIRLWALLLWIIFSEHLYLVVRSVVRYVVRKMDRPGLQKERAERLAMRKHLLQETLGQDLDLTVEDPGPGLSGGRRSHARLSKRRPAAVHSGVTALRKRCSGSAKGGAAESIEVGRMLMLETKAGEPTKE